MRAFCMIVAVAGLMVPNATARQETPSAPQAADASPDYLEIETPLSKRVIFRPRSTRSRNFPLSKSCPRPKTGSECPIS